MGSRGFFFCVSTDVFTASNRTHGFSSEGSKNITIGDVGVYDNLRIGLIDYLEQQQSPEQNILFIVSDAGLPFQNGFVSTSSYNWMLDRVARASDI
ncbi:MAG: hypothetical protein JWP89_1587 [Schlesneria sp.]|nr:hypothetical protein [Schlesneria sp.]